MAFRENGAFAQISDSFLAFFTKIVPFSGLFMYNFSSARNLESLLGPTVCFHFWHIIFQIKIIKQI